MKMISLGFVACNNDSDKTGDATADSIKAKATADSIAAAEAAKAVQDSIENAAKNAGDSLNKKIDSLKK
jgi:hypothetical protein